MSETVETLGVEIEIGAKISDAAKKAIADLKKEFEKVKEPGDAAAGTGAGESLGDSLDGALSKAKERGTEVVDIWDSINSSVQAAADSIAQQRWKDEAASAMSKKLEQAAAKAKAEADALAMKWDSVRTAVEAAADAIQKGRVGPRSYSADDPAGDWADDGGGSAIMSSPRVDRSQTLGSYLDLDKEFSDGETGRDVLVTLEIFKRKVLGPIHREIEKVASEAWGKFSAIANTHFDRIVDTGRKASDVLKSVFGENIFTDAIDGVLDALDNAERIGSKVKTLGETIAKYAPKAGGWIAAIGGAIGAVVPLVVGGISVMIGAVVSFAAAFALPITAVVATIGILGYAWREAAKESEEAVKKMEEADEKLRALRPRQIQQANEHYERQRRLLANTVDGILNNRIPTAEIGTAGALKLFDDAEIARIKDARAEVQKFHDEVIDLSKTQTREERVIGSEDDRLRSQLAVQQQSLEITRKELAYWEERVTLIDRALSKTRELMSATEAGLAVMERQEQARMSTRERLARLAPGQRDAGLAAFNEFRTTGNTDAGQRAERILGFQIDAVGQKLAESIKVGNDVLDDFNAKISDRDQQLVEAVQKAAGGQGIEAVKQYLAKLSETEADQVRILDEAKSKLKSESTRLGAIIKGLMDEITRLNDELIKAERDRGMGG